MACFTMCGFVYKTQLFAKSPKIQYVSNVLCALGPTLRWDSNHLEISVSVQTLSPTIHIAPIFWHDFLCRSVHLHSLQNLLCCMDRMVQWLTWSKYLQSVGHFKDNQKAEPVVCDELQVETYVYQVDVDFFCF